LFVGGWGGLGGCGGGLGGGGGWVGGNMDKGMLQADQKTGLKGKGKKKTIGHLFYPSGKGKASQGETGGKTAFHPK